MARALIDPLGPLDRAPRLARVAALGLVVPQVVPTHDRDATHGPTPALSVQAVQTAIAHARPRFQQVIVRVRRGGQMVIVRTDVQTTLGRQARVVVGRRGLAKGLVVTRVSRHVASRSR